MSAYGFPYFVVLNIGLVNLPTCVIVDTSFVDGDLVIFLLKKVLLSLSESVVIFDLSTCITLNVTLLSNSRRLFSNFAMVFSKILKFLTLTTQFYFLMYTW